MSNFNMTSPHAAGSAISLGGEWTSRDQTEANKYKNTLYSHMKQRGRHYKKKQENHRPKSTPGLQFSEAEGTTSPSTQPPKSAPPGSRPRCDRFFEVDQWAGRRALTPHLKVKKSPRCNSRQDESRVVHEYSLGSGMTMAKSKNRVSVTIDTGLPMTPPPNPQSPRQSPDIGSGSNAERPGHQSSAPVVSGSTRPRSAPDWSGRGTPGVINGSTGSPRPGTTLFSPDSESLHKSTPSSVSSSPSLSEALIAQLQQQVADLTLYLGEERLNHKSTKEKAAAALKERLQELDSKHLERYHQMQEDYEDKMDVMKQIHTKEKEHQKTTLNMQIAKMRGELEFLQGAFDAYKKTLVQDMEEKWAKKEQDLTHRLQEEMDGALHQQRIEMLEERNLDQNSASREFHEQMQEMAKDHQKEMEAMMKKFSTASSDVENLRRALDQLKAVRDELDQTAEKLAITEETLQDTRQELQEANLKVLNYQDNFQNQVNEVDSKYKIKMDHLLQENAELRRRYIGKCEELFSEKSNTEYRRVAKIASTKELLQMIVHTKNRANVNMASGDKSRLTKTPPLKLVRPTSAPITERESRFAFQSAGIAGSGEQPTAKEESARPNTTSPRRRRLNRETLHEKSFRTLKASSLNSL